MTDKSFFDHVSDWLRILLKSGVPALLIGLGFVLVFACSVYLGSSWTTNAGFEVGAVLLPENKRQLQRLRPWDKFTPCRLGS